MFAILEQRYIALTESAVTSGSAHGNLRTTAARRPQPDALRRFGGVGAHSRRAARDRSSSALADLLADGITGRVGHGTAHLASSQRYHLTANGIRETAGFLGFETPSDFVRAYPVSREWLTLLIRRMDADGAIFASPAPTFRTLYP